MTKDPAIERTLIGFALTTAGQPTLPRFMARHDKASHQLGGLKQSSRFKFR
jgi:hypothetical protein